MTLLFYPVALVVAWLLARALDRANPIHLPRRPQQDGDPSSKDAA